MFILEIEQNLLEACSDPGIVSILKVVQRVLEIVHIVVPIIMICGAIWALIKLVLNPEGQEQQKRMKALINSLVAGIIVFFLPYVVNLVMALVGDSFRVTACWNVAAESGDFVQWDDKNVTNSKEDKKQIITGEDGYKFE